MPRWKESKPYLNKKIMKNHRVVKKVLIFPLVHNHSSLTNSKSKKILFLFARIIFSAWRWLQMIKQSAKAANDLGIQIILRNTQFQLWVTSFSVYLRQWNWHRIIASATVSVERMAPLSSQEMMLNTVMFGFFGIEGLSDLKDERWRRGEEKKKHSLFKKRNILWDKTTIIWRQNVRKTANERIISIYSSPSLNQLRIPW